MFKIKYKVQWQNPNHADIFRGYTTTAKNNIFLSIANYRGSITIEILTHDKIGTRLIARVPGCKANNKKELYKFIKIVGYDIDLTNLKEF